jgi:peptidase M50B-like protein
VIAVMGLVPRTTLWSRAAASLHVLSTIVHEAGHAAMSLVTGGGVYIIEIHSPHSGLTVSWVNSRLSSIARSAAGYAAPPLAGLGIAAMLARGHAEAVLMLTTALMVMVLIVSRDLVTIASVLLVGAATFAAFYWGSAGVQQWVGYTEAWLLLLCETAGLWELVRARITGHQFDNGDDAAALAGQTYIPAVVWIVAWYALNGWALWTAAPLLWP